MSDKTLVSFDFAIKYLLKDKADYEIVEGFISALLASEGYPPIKIKALLESESNREEPKMKRSIADLIVEDTAGHKYVVEIDRSWTDLFLNKACFNTSRLIVDSIASGDDYSTIEKVFHINLLYFPFAGMQSPVYHGKTLFHSVSKERPVDLHVMDMSGKIFDAHNVFPEYFVISVPLFDDVVKQELDEWLYVMKNSETRKDFKSPYMAKVAERLNILKMSEEDRAEYNLYRSESLKARDYLVSAERRGREEGITEGIEKGKAEERTILAKNFLKQGIGLEIVSAATGFSTSELKEFCQELKRE